LFSHLAGEQREWMGEPQPHTGLQPDQRRLLVTFLVALGIGLALIVLVRGTPQSWCNFTEFGYLSRIPWALTLIAEIGLAVLLGIGGLIAYLAGRAPRLPFAIAAGLLSAVAISWVMPRPAC
jgi:hypothetical protein